MSDKSIVAVIIIGIFAIGCFISAIAFTHVDRYYMASSGTGRISSVSCAWAHWTGWHSDEIAYCSDDASKVIEWVVKANASIK